MGSEVQIFQMCGSKAYHPLYYVSMNSYEMFECLSSLQFGKTCSHAQICASVLILGVIQGYKKELNYVVL